MALAVANIREVVDLPGPGGRGTRMLTADVTLDTSYPTGGSPGLAGLLGLSTVAALMCVSERGFGIDYLVATDLLKVFQQPAAAAAGAMPEVPNATNLSANTIKVFAVGT